MTVHPGPFEDLGAVARAFARARADRHPKVLGRVAIDVGRATRFTGLPDHSHLKVRAAKGAGHRPAREHGDGCQRPAPPEVRACRKPRPAHRKAAG